MKKYFVSRCYKQQSLSVANDAKMVAASSSGAVSPLSQILTAGETHTRHLPTLLDEQKLLFALSCKNRKFLYPCRFSPIEWVILGFCEYAAV
jgi:hypothetical protein